MRQRDYLFAGDAHRSACGAILGQLAAAAKDIAALTLDQIEGRDALAVLRIWRNSMAALHRMTEEVSPSSIWRSAKLNELTRDTRKVIRWKARALGVNPESQNIDIAVSGMAPYHDGEKWLLAIALPAPEPMNHNPDYEPDDLILLDPATGNASVHGDASSLLFLPMETDRFTVHACAKTWAREFATARVEWLYSKFNAQKIANITPIWTGLPPSALLIGDISKVRWPRGAVIEAGKGIEARKLQFAIYDQSRTSRVHQPQNIGRVA